ncbi:hypothetical protein B0H34DRAFT_132054 [Crassisporium funariophilum]|nr:hypothetical protein B0H34DRAFT_132054 [Crassisporium funariophilum]
MQLSFFNSLALLTALLSARGVIALVPRSPFSHLIVPRQSTCDSDCATFDSALSSCTTTGCLCVPAVSAGLQQCINCFLSGNPSQDIINTAQQLANTFADTCAGFGLAPVTVSANPTPPVVQPPITPPVVTPPAVTPRPAPPVVTPPVVTPPPVTQTPRTVDGPTVSQTVVRPVTTISTNPNSAGTGLPGLNGALSKNALSAHGGLLLVGGVAGVWMVLAL